MLGFCFIIEKTEFSNLCYCLLYTDVFHVIFFPFLISDKEMDGLKEQLERSDIMVEQVIYLFLKSFLHIFAFLKCGIRYLCVCINDM